MGQSPIDTSTATTKAVLPFGLTLLDIARVPFTAALIVAVVALWFQLQSTQQSYVQLARSCPVPAVATQGTIPR